MSEHGASGWVEEADSTQPYSLSGGHRVQHAHDLRPTNAMTVGSMLGIFGV